MNIHIYDDNLNDLTNTKEIVEKYFNERNLEYTVETFQNIVSIRTFLEESFKIDILLLDIELGEYSGLELAKEVRKYNKDIRIIFISDFDKYLIEGYKVQAERFFIKPLNYYEFSIELDAVLVDYIVKNKYFYVPNISNKKLYYQKILYIERINRKTIFHMLTGKIETHHSLQYIYQELDKETFIYCHRAYIINYINISDYSKFEINLITGETISMSRNRRKDFKIGYLKFISKRM